MISFEISNDLREKLRLDAFQDKTNISTVIRKILESYFKKEIDK